MKENITTSTNPSGKVLVRKNGMMGGVAGGFADYFDLDVTIIRLLLVALTLVAGPVIPLTYLVAWIVIPREDAARPNRTAPSESDPLAVG